MRVDERIKKLERERIFEDGRRIMLQVNTPSFSGRMTVDEFIAAGLDFLTDGHIVQGNDPADVKKLLDYMAPGSVIK